MPLDTHHRLAVTTNCATRSVIRIQTDSNILASDVKGIIIVNVSILQLKEQQHISIYLQGPLD